MLDKTYINYIFIDFVSRKLLNISFILENQLKVTKENGIETIEEKKFAMVTDKNYFSMYFYFSRNIYILHNYSAYGVYIKNGATFDYDSISEQD
jgi:hypothetical protein